jgi:hypothetical protein
VVTYIWEKWEGAKIGESKRIITQSTQNGKRNVAMAKRNVNGVPELFQQQADVFMVRNNCNRDDDPNRSYGINEYRTGIKPDTGRIHGNTSFFQSGKLAVY